MVPIFPGMYRGQNQSKNLNAFNLDGTGFLYVCTHNLSNQHMKHHPQKNLRKMKCLQDRQPLHKVLESALNRFAYSARP